MVGEIKSEPMRVTPKHVLHMHEKYWGKALLGIGYDDLQRSIYAAASNPDLIAIAAKKWARQVGAPNFPTPRTSKIEDELARLRGDLVRRGR